MRHQVGRAAVWAIASLLTAGCQGSRSPATATRDTPPPASTPPRTCEAPALAAGSGCWRQVLPLGSGGFPPAPGSQDSPQWAPGRFPLTLIPQVAFGDQLWMVARLHAYSSPDGLAWTQHDKTDWGDRIYQTVVYFRDRLWMYGGMDYESGTFLNDIWESTDGSTWTLAGSAAWPARGSQTMLVFGDQLWLFGGANHVRADRGTDAFLNDVWVSDDGLTWRRVTTAAPWTARELPGVVELGDDLYLVGGQGSADVWRSSNGREWTQLTAEAGWEPRMGYGRAVFGGRLWVLGGWVDRPTNALDDVWSSPDGVTWDRQAEHAPWSPRSPVVTVFRDRLWIYSGMHTGGTDNWGGDLWQMTVGAAPGAS